MALLVFVAVGARFVVRLVSVCACAGGNVLDCRIVVRGWRRREIVFVLLIGDVRRGVRRFVRVLRCGAIGLITCGGQRVGTDQ